MRTYTARIFLLTAAAMLLSFGYPPPPAEASSFRIIGGSFKFLGGSFAFGTYFNNSCDSSNVLDDEGNEYTTVSVGSQCWMGENMRIGTRINGNVAQTNNGTIEKYCYQNNDANCTSDNPTKPDGGLYQWDEAMQYSTTPGARGICPAGWHIPTDAELYTLESFLDPAVNDPNATGYRGIDIGTKLKPGGGSGLGFNLAGIRATDSSFTARGTNAYVWSSSESSGTLAWARRLSSTEARSDRISGGKVAGISVRCLKDS